MQIKCTLLQTGDHASTSSFIFTDPMLFLTPNQQRQSTQFTVLQNHISAHTQTEQTQYGHFATTHPVDKKKITTRLQTAPLLTVNDNTAWMNRIITSIKKQHLHTALSA